MSKTAEPAKPATQRVGDPELLALNKIGTVLNGLDFTTLQRVLAWINSRYQPSLDEQFGKLARDDELPKPIQQAR